MKKRNFNQRHETFSDNIATWNYYTDFQKVYKNVDSIKIELNILNSLIGSKNIKDEFVKLCKKYPEVLKVIPILLAKREHEITVNDVSKTYTFNFKNPNYTIDEYTKFMEKTGLFDLISNHIVNNLVDYVTGVEVGLDSNARKNRTGHSMENFVESTLVKYGYKEGETYFKEITKTQLEKKFKLDLSPISNNGKTEKRFDFAFIKSNRVYAIECNFYNSSGSKLNETARSYKTLAIESKSIENFTFIWLTDGKGWNDAIHNLEETFDVLPTVFNIKDLENGALNYIDDYVEDKKDE